MTQETSTVKAPESEHERQTEELSAYDKLVQQVRANMERVTAVVDAEAFKRTIDKTANELKDVGEHSWKAISKAADTLKKDLVTSTEHVKPAMEALGKGAGQTFGAVQGSSAKVWNQFAEGSTGTLFAWRDWTGSAASEFLKGVSTWSAKMGDQLDKALVYHTGEMTHGGTFKCQDCETEVTLKKPGHLPPCPKCHQTQFRRT